MQPSLVPTPHGKSDRAGIAGFATPETPLKTLQIVFSLDVGGLERFVINLAHAFRPYKLEPFVFCLSQAGALARQLSADTAIYMGHHRPEGKILDWQTMRQIVRLYTRQGY